MRYFKPEKSRWRGGQILKSRSLRSLFVQAAVVATWGILAASGIVFPDLALGDLVAFLGLGSAAG